MQVASTETAPPDPEGALPEGSRAPDTGSVPGRRRGRLSKGQWREQAIIDAAATLLEERSLDSLTVDELAAAVGISRSSFYFYFGSLDAVVRALAIRIGGELEELMEDPRTETLSGEAVGSMLHTYLDRWIHHGHILRAMHSRYETDQWMREFWLRITDDVRTRLAGLIEAAWADGRSPRSRVPASDLAAVLGAMAWRCGYELSLDPSAETQARMADAMCEVWIATLRGNPS